jgi:ribosome-associated heat shock protein Hsp15
MKLRWDKFIWSVRLAKTRSIATELLAKGKIKINGETVKPAKEVKIGDVINVHKNSAVFSFKVLNFLDKRVGAALAVEFIKDVTPIEEIEKYKNYQATQRIYRETDGKPTKKDRRALDEFLEDWE